MSNKTHFQIDINSEDGIERFFTAADFKEYHKPKTTWAGRFQGRTWRDMPGADNDIKKMNFAFFRRGVYFEGKNIQSARIHGAFSGMRKPEEVAA